MSRRVYAIKPGDAVKNGEPSEIYHPLEVDAKNLVGQTRGVMTFQVGPTELKVPANRCEALTLSDDGSTVEDVQHHGKPTRS